MTTDSPSLLDLAAGLAARDEALVRVDRNADSRWKDHVDRTIRRLASTRAEITTDDVWQALADAGVEPPREPRALGSAMKRAAAAGEIAATDRIVQSARPACHARPVRVWRSLVTTTLL